jgi:hypothetical protein
MFDWMRVGDQDDAHQGEPQATCFHKRARQLVWILGLQQTRHATENQISVPSDMTRKHRVVRAFASYNRGVVGSCGAESRFDVAEDATMHS